MIDKKKQTAAAMATVLSVATIATPLSIHAQEEQPVSPPVQQEGNKQRTAAPAISLPENLQASKGSALKEITLPEGWTWTDDSMVITAETAEYPARIHVDDVTYDYSTTEGYHAQGHYVERMVSVTVKPVPTAAKKTTVSRSSVPSTYAAGDIEINETNFPDEAFRTWLETQSYGADGKIEPSEIPGITRIDVSSKPAIKSLTGIGHFTALTYLNCNRTGITELNVSNNKELTTLYCSNTGLSHLDVSQNTNLTTLGCSITNIAELNLRSNVELKELECEQTKLKSLDVSNNTALNRLFCGENPDLTSINVTGVESLTVLHCQKTGITSLDVTDNTNLGFLYCYETNLTSLDLSKNTELYYLVIRDTGITSLDVSSNTALTNLNFERTPLAYLNIGTQNGLYTHTIYKDNLKSIDVTVKGGGFDISDKFAGIDESKISIPDEAIYAYDPTTGRFSNYTIGESITYIYECGTYSNGSKLLSITVTLNLLDGRENGSIEVTENLNKNYDGTAVSDAPAVHRNGTGAVSYKWEKKTGEASWTIIDAAPVNAGTYRVTASVTADDNYKSADSDPKEFTITKADSSISFDGSLNLNKTYNGNAVEANPSVTKTGSNKGVTYKWEKKIGEATWTEIDSAPVNAGTYRVTASVTADDNYKSATSVPKEFIIAKAVPYYVVPKDLEAVYGQTLTDIKLPEGYRWTDAEKSVGNVGMNTFTASYTPGDTRNYKAVNDISISVMVRKAENALTNTLSMEDWTFGETPAVASVGFRYGCPRIYYSGRINGTYTETVPTSAGTWYAKAVVEDTDNYSGVESAPVSFVIEPKKAEKEEQLKVPDITSDTNLDKLILKDGDKVLVQGSDYDIAKVQDGNKVTVTITFKGNYEGVLTKSYTMGKETSSQGSVDKSEDKKSTNVQTGDTTSAGLWGALLAWMSGVMLLVGRNRRKEE